MNASSPRIEIRNVSKTFRREGGDIIRPIDNVSMTVSQDEMVVLLGPSGCGKTTLLRCVAGLEKPDAGEILIDGKVVFSSRDKIMLSPEDRGISMIFQSFALWPHMTVFDNVAYPLQSRKVAARTIPDRVNRILEIAGVGGLGAQFPGRISGGQQQRVALARALVSDSSVVLFDEPLSNVDTQVRARLRLELRKLHREIKFSALYVTHDQTEALELGDQVAVLDRGRVADLGQPRRVYDRPATEYVANFVGVANVVPCTVDSAESGKLAIKSALGDLVASAVDGERDWRVGQVACAVIRPEHLRIATDHYHVRENRIMGTVTAVMFAGAHTEIVMDAGGTTLRVWTNDAAAVSLNEGASVALGVSPDKIHLVENARSGAST